MELRGYSLEKRLHQGKSIVYRGVRREDNLPVIVKMLRGDFPTPRQISAIRREYELLGQLHHPGIVRPIELATFGSSPAIVMEDFGAISLTDWKKTFDLEVFLDLACSVVRSLGYIHRQGIIHKDIKPRNLVVHPETLEIKFIDFSISSQLKREAQSAQGLQFLEGSLAYISPEHTGRMNRQVDQRSDYYSLGATFYEMLTGQPPFDSEDSLELVHSHIARLPESVHERAPRVPQALSSIVMKLLAKTPEERYQSAHGLEEDLKRCREELSTGRAPVPFKLATKDISETLQISQRLYGRERELEELLATFRRVEDGHNELLMVAGYPGIGKSALVREVEKLLAQSRGYFIQGKFDQFKRNLPYSALSQAFGGLVRQLLTEDERRLDQWRERLREALGPSGSIITEVIPEMGLIIGEQSPVEALGPTETQFRFNRVFRRFVGVFARSKHPLALFLDDLQWADAASLALLEVLLTDPEGSGLLLIGAYRDNEVDESHPLRGTLRSLEKAGTSINTLELLPLSRNDVEELVADSLNQSPTQVATLVDMLMKKTDGNPFFVSEFLLSLQEEGLLFLQGGAWAWDLQQIHQRAITNNVIELMANKLQKLPDSCLRLVKRAACAGGTFNLSMLSVISESSPVETARALWPAVEQGLVQPLSEGYKFLLTYEAGGLPPEATDVGFKFLHDRVQQAAYSLINDEQRSELHLRLGRLLLESRPEEDLEELLFDVVGHWNQVVDRIQAPSERLALARYNLQAGKKAAASTAYAPALTYCKVGLQLLSESAFTQHYELAFELHLEHARGLFLTGQYEPASAALARLLEQAQSAVDRVRVVILQIFLHQMKGNIDGILQLAIAEANRLGLEIPETPGEGDIPAELGKIAQLLGDRDVDALDQGQPMTEPEKLSVMNLLAFMGPAAYLAIQSRPGLWQIAVLKSISYSLEHGYSPFGVYSYCSYGIILGPGMGRYEEAHKWGCFAVRIAEKAGDRTAMCISSYLHGAFLDTWINHLDSSMNMVQRAFQYGLDAGNLMWCSLTHSHVGMTPPQQGKPLSEVIEAEQHCLAFADRLQAADIARYYRLLTQWARALMGKTRGPVDLSDEEFDEEAFFQEFEATNFKIPLHTSHLAKVQLGVFFRRFDLARKHYEASKQIVGSSFGLFQTLEHYFYGALAALGDVVPGSEGAAAALEEVKESREKLLQWEKSGPANTRPRRLLVEAEVARIEGREVEASNLYEQAIDSAAEGNFLHIQGLAGELGAHHQLALKKPRFARALLAEARHAYQLWGATAKVNSLEEEHQSLLGATSRIEEISIAQTSQTSTARTTHQSLDLNTVLKASQAISSEIVLGKLLNKIMAIVLENAGAQRALLILSSEGRLVIEAERTLDGSKPTHSVLRPVEGHPQLPQSIIQYVARSQEAVVLANAATDPRYARDPYVLEAKPRSLLCSPILHQGKLAGLLYLENNIATGAFTPERLQLLRMLSAQAAIAIENARLYDRLERYSHKLEEKVKERTREIEERNGQLAATLQEVVAWKTRLSDELADAVAFVRALLPPPTRDPLPIDWRFLPSAELGGDGFGYLAIDDDHTALYLIDVCGHGIASALFSISVMTTISSQRLPDVDFRDPNAVLTALNGAFPSASYNNQYFTIWYGVYSRSRRELTFSSGGHPPAMLLGDAQTPPRTLSTSGPMVGVMQGLTFPSERCSVPPGSSLYIYSDGAYEIFSPDDKLLNLDNFLNELARGGEGTLDRMVRFAYQTRGQERLEDDFAMVEVQFP